MKVEGTFLGMDSYMLSKTIKRGETQKEQESQPGDTYQCSFEDAANQLIGSIAQRTDIRA